MKTPDEIKKGQKTRRDAKNVCYECEFSNGFMCYALTRIQPLKDANTELLTKVEQLETENHQLKREKDALLTDLRATDPCDNCKHCDTAHECNGDCSFCDHSETCQCRECDDDSHWEWAGIKEDNQ